MMDRWMYAIVRSVDGLRFPQQSGSARQPLCPLFASPGSCCDCIGCCALLNLNGGNRNHVEVPTHIHINIHPHHSSTHTPKQQHLQQHWQHSSLTFSAISVSATNLLWPEPGTVERIWKIMATLRGIPLAAFRFGSSTVPKGSVLEYLWTHQHHQPGGRCLPPLLLLPFRSPGEGIPLPQAFPQTFRLTRNGDGKCPLPLE